MRRKLVLGDYDTDLHGPWTLAAWELSAAEYQSNFVTVPGRNGDVDLSTALTDGEPRYGSRTLTATLERSDGSRLQREEAISTMVNWLDGWRVNIQLPDDDAHYLIGRVRVIRQYNDMAHAAVAVEAICDPWRYNHYETVVGLTPTPEPQLARLSNHGRRSVVPLVEVSGVGAQVLLTFEGFSWSLGPGAYQLPDMVVRQGGAYLDYSGTGELKLTYREAVL